MSCVDPADFVPGVSSQPPPDLNLAELQRYGLPVGARLIYVPAHPNNYTCAENAPNRPRSHLAICLHTAEEPANATASTPGFFQNPNVGVSTGYFVAQTGDLYQLVRDKDFEHGQGVTFEGPGANAVFPYPPWFNRATHFGYNNVMTGIEIEGCSDHPDSYYTSPCARNDDVPPSRSGVTVPAITGGIGATMQIGGRQWATLVALCSLLCSKYGIPVTSDRFVRHSELSTHKRDPGPGLQRESLLRDVRQQLNQVAEIGSPVGGTYIDRPIVPDPTAPPADPTAPTTMPTVPTGLSSPPIPTFDDEPRIFGDPVGRLSDGGQVRDGALTARSALLVINANELAPVEITSAFRIRFSVQYDTEIDDKPWIAEVYNLSTQTEARISERGTSYELSAGYGGVLGLIGEGHIRTIERVWEPPNRITRLLLGTPLDFSRGDSVVHVYGNEAYPLVKVDQLVRGMGARLDASAQQYPELLARRTTWSYVGAPQDGLTKLLDRYGLNWVHSFGTVRLSRKATAPATPVRPEEYDLFDTDARQAFDEAAAAVTKQHRWFDWLKERRGEAEVLERPFTLSEETGLIGQPARTETGIRARIRLTSELLPHRFVALRSRLLQGSYVVTATRHVGDTWEGDFFTEVDAIDVGADG